MQLMKFSTLLLLLSFTLVSHAIVDGHEYQFDSGDALQNQSRADLFRQLAEELRCPKCQNQNLSDSNAMIAGDLRRELYSQVKDGKNSEEIVDFMVDRYGEFVLYRPALNNKTIALWYGPFVLIAVALFIFIGVIVARKSKSKTDVQSLKQEQTDTSVTNDPLSDDEQKRIDALLNPEPMKSDSSDNQSKEGK